MISVNIDVQVDDEVLETMTYEPGRKFALKLVQRDRTYDGTQEPQPADFIYKITRD